MILSGVNFPVRVDLGATANNKYSTFPKTSRLEPHNQMVLFHIQDTRWRGELASSSQMKPVYSTAPADCLGGNCTNRLVPGGITLRQYMRCKPDFITWWILPGSSIFCYHAWVLIYVWHHSNKMAVCQIFPLGNLLTYQTHCSFQMFRWINFIVIDISKLLLSLFRLCFTDF